MQKLCCVHTRQHPLPVWSHKFVLSSPTHFSTNSRPFLVGIVSTLTSSNTFVMLKSTYHGCASSFVILLSLDLLLSSLSLSWWSFIMGSSAISIGDGALPTQLLRVSTITLLEQIKATMAMVHQCVGKNFMLDPLFHHNLPIGNVGSCFSRICWILFFIVLPMTA